MGISLERVIKKEYSFTLYRRIVHWVTMLEYVKQGDWERNEICASFLRATQKEWWRCMLLNVGISLERVKNKEKKKKNKGIEWCWN